MSKYLVEFKHLDSSSDYPSVNEDNELFESIEEIAKFIVGGRYDKNFKVINIHKLINIAEVEKSDLASFIAKENQRIEKEQKIKEKQQLEYQKNLKKQTEELQYQLYKELKAKFEPDTVKK